MKIGVRMSLQISGFYIFGIDTQEQTVESYDTSIFLVTSIFNDSRNLHSVFQCIFPPTVYEAFLFLQSLQPCGFWIFSILAILGIRWYLIIIFICISLLTSFDNNFSSPVPCDCLSSVGEMSIQCFFPFSNRVAFLCMSSQQILDG